MTSAGGLGREHLMAPAASLSPSDVYIFIKQLLGPPGTWPAPGTQLSKVQLSALEGLSATQIIV